MKIDLKKWMERSWLDAAMVVVFVVVSFAYFHEPVAQGLVLGGHDSDAATLQGREQQEYRLAHDGETTRCPQSLAGCRPVSSPSRCVRPQ